MIAQATPDPVALASFLEVAFYLVGLVTAAVLLWRQWHPAELSPQPLTVREHTNFATAKDLKEAHGRISREREEINRELEAVKAEQRAQREKLSLEIGKLHERIDAVPQRTITLLRETKDLI